MKTVICVACGKAFPPPNNGLATTCRHCRHADKLQRQLTAMEREWRVVYDSSGDFTNKWFGNLEVECMRVAGSFDPGTVLEDSAGRQYQYDVNKRRLVAMEAVNV